MSIRSVLLWISVLPLIGCGSDDAPVSDNFGRFEGQVVASWDDDGRNMTLREDFAYIDPRNRKWLAPAGSVVNGASIPAAFWSFIGGPFEGKYRNASVVHDVGCGEMKASWEEVHRVFYEACRCGGVDERMAKTLYYAVYHFGPRWQLVAETRTETSVNEAGQTVEKEVIVERVARLDPPPPTPEEVEQVEALIVEENPEVAAIEQTDRQALRRRPRRGDGGRDGHESGAGRKTTPEQSMGADEKPVEDHEIADDVRKTDVRGATGRKSGRGKRPAGAEDQAQRNDSQGRPLTEHRDTDNRDTVTPREVEWAIEKVRQHLEELAGEERPAEYTVERVQGGYRVVARYLQVDDQGQATGESTGTSTVLLSRKGQILEVVSEM